VSSQCILARKRKKVSKGSKRAKSNKGQLTEDKLAMRAATGLDGIPSFPGRASKQRGIRSQLKAAQTPALDLIDLSATVVPSSTATQPTPKHLEDTPPEPGDDD
jgi:hypothetical protein